jgi:uncharacterized protein DUF4845
MRRGIEGQRGLGLFGLIFVIAIIGFFALIVVKVTPIYINQMTMSKDLHEIAGQFSNGAGEVEVPQIVDAVQKRWAVDYISQVNWNDIKVARTEKGLSMTYDYEARVLLFYNIYLVIHFADEIPVRP